jgi:hypothetical protein
MILLGTADAGPARYLIELCSHLDVQFDCVGNDLTDQMFVKNGLQLNPDWKNCKPLAVITGTSLGNSLDKKMIQWANQLGFPSFSLIDHWSWYRKRFELNGELILPDFIFVNDDIAYADAVNEGLPSEKLIIAGNPVLESLHSRDKGQQIDREKLLCRYNLPSKRIIFFISEELASEFNGTDDELGYDEFSALDQIISLLQPSDHLVIKLHPEETEDKYQHLKNEHVSVLRGIDIYSLNTVADVVVGMASMLLLELAMLRNDVISFRPNATKRFIGERLSATVDVTSQEGLDRILSCPQYLDGKFRERFDGSSARIASLIKSIIG